MYNPKREIAKKCFNASQGGSKLTIEQIESVMQEFADQEVERRTPTHEEIYKQFPNTEYPCLMQQVNHERRLGAFWAIEFVREEPKEEPKPPFVHDSETWQQAIENCPPEKHRYAVLLEYIYQLSLLETEPRNNINTKLLSVEAINNESACAEAIIELSRSISYAISIVSTSAIRL